MRGVEDLCETRMACGDSPAWQNVETGLLLRSRVAQTLNVHATVRLASSLACGLAREKTRLDALGLGG